MKAILVFTMLILIVTPCMSIADGKPISMVQNSFNLLEDGPPIEGGSSMSLYSDRSAIEISIPANEAEEIQPNEYGNSSAAINSLSLLVLNFPIPSGKSNQKSEIDSGLNFLSNKPLDAPRNIDEAHNADTDLRSNVSRDLMLVEGYEYDEKDDITRVIGQDRRSEIYNLNSLSNHGNSDDLKNQIRIKNQHDLRDHGGKPEYFYESKIRADNKDPFSHSNIDNLNYITRYDNNDNQGDNIPIANQFNWQDTGFQSGHEYEYQKSAVHEYQYPEAKRDSISIYETDPDNKNQVLIANQNPMPEDRATSLYKYQYEKNLENFNKIIELENTKAGINNDSENIAVVIGIDNYDSMPKLHNSVNDADAISKIIKDYEYKVIKITDKSSLAPTKENLEMAFSYMERKYKDKNVLIYYSGHGEIDDSGNFYFVPKDGNDSVSSYISGNELEQRTDSLENLAIIIDACNSGAYNVEKPGRLVIASSESNQKSNEEWFGKLSVFTNSLYKALDEKKTSGKDVILQDCFRAAYNYTKSWELWPLLRQNPIMIGATEEAHYL